MHSSNQQAAIQHLLENGEATFRELADALGVTNKKIQNLLQNIQRYGQLVREGKNIGWYRTGRKNLHCKSGNRKVNSVETGCGAGMSPEQQRIPETKNFGE
ncbi:hypothetical protein MXT18_11315 [Escherichia coli]|uniref:hypothetical protein n=1 Tax=Escherichia coli TaxID=562 RepID=UPI001E0FE82E|nr:hypothetical protein [Escherichia coli]EFN9097304.1 hypothetical protein [Escherichia coli]MDT9445808.1 hypothetical protein [Escherichia coli]